MAVLLLDQHKNEKFNKKVAEEYAEIIFEGLPSQKRVFKFICYCVEQGNGVANIYYQSIITFVERTTGKTPTKSAVSQLVKKLVKLGALEYATAMQTNGKNTVGTFRVARMTDLRNLAAIARQKVVTMKQNIEKKIEETKVVIQEATKEALEMLDTALKTVKEFTQPKPKKKSTTKKQQTGKSFSNYKNRKPVRVEIVPDWALPKEKQMKKEVKSEISKEELQALIDASFKK